MNDQEMGMLGRKRGISRRAARRVFVTDFGRAQALLRRFGFALCAGVSLLCALVVLLVSTNGWTCELAFRATAAGGGAALESALPAMGASDALAQMTADALGFERLPGALGIESEGGGSYVLIATATQKATAVTLANTAVGCCQTLAGSVAEGCVLAVTGEPALRREGADWSAMLRCALVALAICLSAYLLVCLTYAMVRNTARIPGHIAYWMGQVCLAALPEEHCRRIHFLEDGATGEFRSAIRALRAATLAQLRAKDRVILVTSAVQGEGKTTVAMNLATALSAGDKRVLLVDANLRRPRLRRALRLPAQGAKGLREVLLGEAALSDALERAEKYHVTILAGKKGESAPMSLLRKDALRTVIDALRRRFDYIVLDAPACGVLTDASILAGLSDGIVLAVEQDRVRITDLIESMEELIASGTPMTGCVLNRCAGRYIKRKSIVKRYRRRG